MQKLSIDLQKIRKNYSKIIFGTATLNNINKIYESYYIPKEEKIIATVKGSMSIFGFGFDGTIITDMAIYFHPNQNNRYSYSELCDYIAFQRDSKSCLELITAETSKSVVDGTLLSSNIKGTELMMLIEDIQQEMFGNFSFAQEQRNSLLKNICKKASELSYAEEFPQHLTDALAKLRSNPNVCSETIPIEAKRIFITHGENQYISFVDKYSEYISTSLKKMLIDNISTLKKEMIDYIGNVDLIISNSFLEKISLAVDTWCDSPKELAFAKCYIDIRQKNTEQLGCNLETYKYLFDETDINNIKLFDGCYKNHSMIKVYNLIKDGKMPSKEMYDWTDSFGLTPLHYAIILKKDEIVQLLLSEKNGFHMIF